MRFTDTLSARHLGLGRPIVIATHPRSGTHLTMDTLRWRAPDCRVWKMPFERLERVYVTTEELVPARPRTSQLAVLSTLLRSPRPLVKTHRLPAFERWYLPPRHDALAPKFYEWLHAQARYVHVYRDGRAALWSYYLLARRSGALRGVRFSEFLRQPSSASPWRNAAHGWAMHVRAWLEQDDAISVAFEELLSAPNETVGRLAAYLDLPIESRVTPLPPVLHSVHDYHMARTPSGHPPSTAVLAPDPVLPARTWRDVFSRDDARFFQEETDGLLLDLGYEKSREWWKRLA